MLVWQSSAGVGGHRQEDLSGGCVEASSLGAGTGGGRGEKRPTSAIAEKVEKKTSRSVGFVFFSQKQQKQ